MRERAADSRRNALFSAACCLLPAARCLFRGAALAVILLTLAVTIADRVLGPPPLAAAEAGSIVVLDREGRLLRGFTTRDGRWRLPVELAEVHPRYLLMLAAFEDRRFRSHKGVDPLAVLRAGIQLATSGHIVSGGSTLTMQVARLLEGRHDRSVAGKLRQMLRAIQLEQRLSKDGILALYLKLAPFGGNLEGVRAASLAYFGKEPLRLSAGEAALLVALPQSPETRRPDVGSAAARRARARVLDRAVEAGVLSLPEAVHAKAEPVPTARKSFPQIAAHLAESMARQLGSGESVRLTVDRDLQSSLERLAAEHVERLGRRLSVAILAIDHTSGEVLAHVGSPGYLDQSRFGAIDMVRAVRSPGSTLKPIIYGLAFEAGLAHPETLIEDKPVRFGRYAPRNFDETFHGTVSVREALQLSLNVPAVKVLVAVGPMRLTARLREAGLVLQLPNAATPSLAIALGGVGMTLEDLVTLYGGLARGGETIPLKHRLDGKDIPAGTIAPQRLLGPVAAWYVQSILAGTPPPHNAWSDDIAYKTGTSYGFRDAWAAGFDGRHTIAVWVGRPDGVPTPGLTGIGAAAPILFDAFARLPGERVALAEAPRGALVASTSTLPPPLRRFRSDVAEPTTGAFADPPVAVAFPPDNSELALTEAGDGSLAAFALKAEGGVLPLTWLVDGAPIVSDPRRREAFFRPAGRGFVKLSVIDAKGQVDRVTISIK